MKIDLDAMLDSYFEPLEQVANSIGFRIEENKAIPKGTVSIEQFKEALGEYLGEEIEAGTNPRYALGRLMCDREDQEIFKEILYDCEKPFDRI